MRELSLVVEADGFTTRHDSRLGHGDPSAARHIGFT
jgi:hypothetical protein